MDSLQRGVTSLVRTCPGKQSIRASVGRWREFTHVRYEMFDRGRRTSEVGRLMFASGWPFNVARSQIPWKRANRPRGNTGESLLVYRRSGKVGPALPIIIVTVNTLSRI